MVFEDRFFTALSKVSSSSPMTTRAGFSLAPPASSFPIALCSASAAVLFPAPVLPASALPLCGAAQPVMINAQLSKNEIAFFIDFPLFYDMRCELLLSLFSII